MITKQTIFEIAANHLLAGELGFDFDDCRCFYRVGEIAAAPGRCFIGAIIPDEMYKPEFDQNCYSPIDIFDELATADDAFSHEIDEDFADELQTIHDDIFVDTSWARQRRANAGSPEQKARAAGQLLDLADQHFLTIPSDLRAKLTALHATFPV